MDTKLLYNLFEKPEQDFTQHLDPSNNHRIIFSGRFGVGKTTFLKYFFEKESDRYHSIHLFPVNYSVLQNDDIFSYIKYDILLSLFSNKDYPLTSEYLGFTEDSDEFIFHNLDQIIASLLLLIPKMGKQLSQFTKELKMLHDHHKEFKKQDDVKGRSEINSFLNEFHIKDGGLYETNLITVIIQNWVRDINKNKETVLIIDDLDRIDPAHIFRLLNVFSAHFDNRDNEDHKNKFGFSKVVFVCDIGNIRNIYQAKYGLKTDFNGYIDKFYSNEIFNYDNIENILSILSEIINRIQVFVINYSGISNVSDSNELNSSFLRAFLRNLLLQNQINLRALLKLYKEEFLIPFKGYQIDGYSFRFMYHPILSVLYILAYLFGDFQVLKNKLNKLEYFKVYKIDQPRSLIGNLACMISTKELFDYVYHDPKIEPREMILNSFQINHTDVVDIKSYVSQPNNIRSFQYYVGEININGNKLNPYLDQKDELDIKNLIVQLIDKIEH